MLDVVLLSARRAPGEGRLLPIECGSRRGWCLSRLKKLGDARSGEHHASTVKVVSQNTRDGFKMMELLLQGILKGKH